MPDPARAPEPVSRVADLTDTGDGRSEVRVGEGALAGARVQLAEPRPSDRATPKAPAAGDFAVETQSTAPGER
jgi:hypothetical protein